MMVIEQINSCESIYNLLLEFDHCFPHLKEKISDYRTFSEKLQKYANVFVVKDETSNIALTCFYANDFQNFCGYITLIGVKSECRGLGLGGYLLDFTEETMKKIGMKSIRLEVDRDNYNAQCFYLKKGFNIEEEKKGSFFMVKEI